MKTLNPALRIAAVAVAMLAASVGAAPAQQGAAVSDRLMVDYVHRRNLGDFGDTWGSASGVFVSYGMAFPDRNLLVFRTGFLTSELADGVTYPDAKLDIVPLHLGGRYVFPLGRVMPFVDIMMGLDVISENTALDGTKADRTHAKFAWEVGAGAIVTVTGPVDIDLSASYGSNFYTHAAMATGFTYTAGLAWNLDR